MGRPAKNTPQAIHLACAKLQAEGNLTVYSLREALGGGGAGHLAASLRRWRQEQRETARVPMEKMVSAGLRAALAEEMQRIRDEAAEEVHSLYAEDKAHVAFCLSEVSRLEQEVDGLHDRLAAEQAEAQRAQRHAERVTRDLTEKLQEQRARADLMTERFESLQRQQQGNEAELAVAREQRNVAEAGSAQERMRQEDLRAQLATATAERAAAGAQVASLEERCAQQRETLGYFRADLQAKTEELASSRTGLAALQQELRETREAAAAAESALQELRIEHQARPIRHLHGFIWRSRAAGAAQPLQGRKRSQGADAPEAF